MKRFSVRFLAAVVGAAVACNAGGTGTAPGRAVGRAAAWHSIGETAACEAMNPQYCRGAFGFVIDSSGNWNEGPGPNGSARSGTLAAAELSTLASAIQDFLAMIPQTCVAVSGRAAGGQVIPGVRNVEILSLAGGDSIAIGGPDDILQNACPGTPQSDSLRTTFDALLAKYYPVPFTD